MRRALPDDIVRDPFGKIRERCALVAERARFVRIDVDALNAYADTLPVEELLTPAESLFPDLGEDPEAMAAYTIALDAINFGSGYFPHLNKLEGKSGYRTVEARLLARFEKAPLGAAELAAIEIDGVAALFHQDLASAPVRELMELFTQAWRDLGRLLCSEFEGRFIRLVEAAECSAESLLRILVAMPLYRDVLAYDQLQVPFFKRAQITAADLSLCLPPELAGFEDRSRMTIFADNLVPHVLRVDGVLHYDAGLLARINREELLAVGSPEEVEIRACAVHCAELMVSRLREAEASLCAADLDYYLWGRGSGARYKSQPRHRARCAFY